jgi:hypothetical protein
VFNYAKSKYTHIYIESLVKYVISVIDYNFSLFRTASRSNYAIIDYFFGMIHDTNVLVRCCIYLTTYDWIKSFLKITIKAEPYMEI